MNDTWRKWFPVSNRITYLNHAGVAPLSTRAAAAMEAAVRECIEWGAFRYGRLLAGIRRARQAAAELLDVHPDHLAFVKNTSEGVSFVAEGFPWNPGDAVVVPEGEFPSNVYPWMNLARRGVRVIRVPERGGRLDLDDYHRALAQPGVRMLAVSAVEYGTGFRNDLAALGELCRERGVFFFVDAIQALGCLPLAPERLGIHALAADGHKWLCGPEGIGLLYLSSQALERLHPVEVGWNSVRDPMAFDRIRFELRPDAARFEAGSPSTVAIHGLGEAARLLLEVGIDRVWAQVQELWGELAEGLRERNYSIVSPLAPRERSGILTFVPRRTAPADLAAGLHAEGVFAAARGPGVRVSPHFYNTTEDLERFFEALDRLDREG
ncbi:MAG: aminotransferase class V-fold PLP-dependent enzyme [Deltaproteobacteria bacterium]|nr:aminotransferase class V-fold PLP-dependent enzyme [Deltaproteobacteria bacterium]